MTGPRIGAGLVGLLLAALTLAGPQPERIDYQVVAVYPHDRGAFTQGLLFHDGALYESTGLRGKSTLRKVKLESGRIVRQRRLAPRLFGEGRRAHAS